MNKHPLGVAWLIGAALVAAPLSVAAADDGLYLSVHGGATFPQSTDSFFDSPGQAFPGLPPDTGLITTEGEVGFRGGGALGVHLGGGFRIEGEAAYQRNELDEANVISQFSPPPGTTVDIEGVSSAITLMGNVLYDLPIGDGFTPYVGVGIGAAHVMADDVMLTGNPVPLNDAAWAFAYQAIAGVAVPFDGFSLGIQYRLMGLDDYTLFNEAGDEQRVDGSLVHSAEVVLTVPFES